MKTIALLTLSVLVLTACGGGAGPSATTNAQNGTNGSPAAFEAPPTPGK